MEFFKRVDIALIIYLDIQVNTVITLPRRIGMVPCNPPFITFLIPITQKILLNIKDAEFDFRMGCILV